MNALGNIKKSGTKASGRRTIIVENEAVRHEDERRKALDIVKDRILGKCGKEYGTNHVLIVVIDDYLPSALRRTKKYWRSSQSLLSKIRIRTLEASFGWVQPATTSLASMAKSNVGCEIQNGKRSFK